MYMSVCILIHAYVYLNAVFFFMVGALMWIDYLKKKKIYCLERILGILIDCLPQEFHANSVVKVMSSFFKY